MPKPPKRKNLKPPGKCIFCGGGNLSKEHFWPSWAADLLPAGTGSYFEHYQAYTEKTKPIGDPKETQRQGAVKTKKLRVVCVTCNNEWMSRLENEAEPILRPLILGNSITLNQSGQHLLAKWITLKVMVGEQNSPPDAVFSQSDREAFKLNCTIPNGISIWVAECGVGFWRTGYIHHTATLGLPNVPLADFRRKNVQATCFGIGNLLVLALASAIPEIDLDEFISIDGNGVFRLWKNVRRNLLWPMRFRLTDAAARKFAMALDSFFASEQVVWKPIPV
ncbi:MAG TPA: hypothetical protein VMF58_01450 [Rhizomicrobium sp.]|nr:hypothetical protein [Rhizomicrobium sp.]